MNVLEAIFFLSLAQWSSVISADDAATLVRSGKKTPPELMSELQPKDVLELKEGEISVFISPDRFVAFRGTGKVITRPDDRWDMEGKIVVREEKIAEKSLAQLFSKETATTVGGGYFRSGGLLTLLTYPVSVAVETRTPTFRWREKIVGKIIVRKTDGKDPIWEAAVASTSLDYPAGEPPLIRGQEYCWESTDPRGKTVETACFRVVGEDESRTAQAIRQAVERAEAPARDPLCRAGVAFLAREARLDAALDLLANCPVSTGIRTIKESIQRRLGLYY